MQEEFVKATKRKKRKPAVVEKIYDSITGCKEKISSHQAINELLAQYRAEYLGIRIGIKFYEDPDIQPFYDAQWKDISNVIREFGARNVLAGIEANKWICDPKYGDGMKPLRMKKFREFMKNMPKEVEDKQGVLPTGHETPTEKKRKRKY